MVLPDWNNVFNTLVGSAAVSIGGLAFRRLRRIFTRIRETERDIEEIRKYLDYPREWRESEE
jgi:hypothetical protein